MRYWGWFEWIIFPIIAVLIAATAGMVVIVVLDETHVSQGRVINKYYDDPDLVCPKACVRTRECWTLALADEPWYDNTECVTKEYYDTVKIGDYYE